MKKVAFFAIVVLFMVVLCYLGPKILYSQTEDGCGNLGGGERIPFALGPGEGAEFNILPQTQPADVTLQSCSVQVMFYDAAGNAINDGTGCTSDPLVRPGIIFTCKFEPEPALTGRTAYRAEITLSGDRFHSPIPISLQIALYDTTTGQTHGGIPSGSVNIRIINPPPTP